MTPPEHLRKMSLLGEPGTLEEKHLYRLASGLTAGELCQRQEMLVRNQMMTVNPPLVGSVQQRLQAIPSQFEPRFLDRELMSSTEMISPADPRQIRVTSHLGPSVPPAAGVSNVLSNHIFSGYGFLQPESLETVARRQEFLQKQNIARMEMEMNTVFQQKEMEKAQRKGLVALESPFIYPGLPAGPAQPFRGRSRLPDGQIPSDLFVRRAPLDDLPGSAILMANGPYPAAGSLPRERIRRPGRRTGSHRASDCHTSGSKSQAEEKIHDEPPATPEEEKDGKRDLLSKPELSKSQGEAVTASAKDCKDDEPSCRKPCGAQREPNGCVRENGKDSSHPCAIFDDKYVYHSAVPLPALPYGLPVTSTSLLPPGTPALFLNGEDLPSVEDIRKWGVEDVYNFITHLPGCSDYAQVFKEHEIDGETLPLLSEEHLLDTMGLKLGPSLKIRSQVSRRLGQALYMASLPLPTPLPSAAGKSSDQQGEIASPLNCHLSGELLGTPCSQDADVAKAVEQTLSETRETPDAQGELQTPSFPKN
ncbi:sterile alpha motif domain-containing protein 7 [Tachyglossus aculeatus]|uniref:sterile alpha motif domain-containing protein 7 n=1 Tax=Tachyglossus aculeatus TaxID=9261 RepID=UPI0018F700B5|nr:sterile alpha motif domain-containing protein 7 [Tachyglossus aculeatus]